MVGAKDDWIGDEAEREWATIALKSIQAKCEDLPRFKPADEYQLLLYDFIDAVPEDLALPAALLAAKLKAWEATAGSFERRFSIISVLQDTRLLYDVRGQHVVLQVTPPM